ncbi:MAG TPA: YciI family protein [Acidimicrobiales bacterium]|nr:YciI family protein [Acidimicrobiales bacterium]
MAQYLILIYEDEAPYASGDQALLGSVMEAHQGFMAAHEKAIVGSNALQPQATATTIRHSEAGDPVITDGPFAETKEALGGYYLVEASDLDEAIKIAEQCPARFGGVEVRPVMVFS